MCNLERGSGPGLQNVTSYLDLEAGCTMMLLDEMVPLCAEDHQLMPGLSMGRAAAPGLCSSPR